MSTFGSDYEWLRSSFCASGACVEVSLSSAGPVLVRDSKLGDASPLVGFTSDAWARVLKYINDGYLPDYAAWLANGGLGWGLLQFTAAEWDVFEAGVKAGEFDYDKLSSGDEAGSGFRGVARSGQAATGAGAIAVPPAPVAAQPTYILGSAAIVDMVERYGNARVAAVVAGLQGLHDAARQNANQADDLLDAIRAALTPVPASEPEPAWGSGPLVKHVTETPGTEPEGAQQ